ncbi:MAG: hypothetical protein SFU27_08000 [Thermonemataceae bacterium]|nr:hypothetical protein [Thermonemataceae bacterium]
MLNLDGFDELEESFRSFLAEPFSIITWQNFLEILENTRQKNLQACLYWSDRHLLKIISFQEKLKKFPLHLAQSKILEDNFRTLVYENPISQVGIDYALLKELANSLDETAE